MEWTPDRIKTLMALWAEGIPTLEIGRRLGVTKNAVVGKVHRLRLPKRQSPISKSPRTRSSRPNAEMVRLARPAPPPPPKGEMISMEMLRPGMCNWPEGEPEAEDFRFCGDRVVEGKPYCAHHCERAYVSGSRERPAKTAKVA
ncbi:MAG: global cell cycle regulator GcrA-like protein [Rhodospirillaceae bacterium]|nr:global cell cycle regulator GcrA-like protein [Rhodospirillaceae bacterium]